MPIQCDAVHSVGAPQRAPILHGRQIPQLRRSVRATMPNLQAMHLNRDTVCPSAVERVPTLWMLPVVQRVLVVIPIGHVRMLPITSDTNGKADPFDRIGRIVHRSEGERKYEA